LQNVDGKGCDHAFLNAKNTKEHCQEWIIAYAMILDSLFKS
jgi:hypothetical protein